MAILRDDFGITGVRAFPTSFAVVSINKQQTAGYFLDGSPDLMTWTPVTPGVAGMVPPRFETVDLIVPAPAGKYYYRLRYEPEIVHEMENPGFEEPAAPPGFLFHNGPGWGPDDDGDFLSSFEHIAGFAESGNRHPSIADGSFMESKGGVQGYRGVHSVVTAIGNRSGLTGAFSTSSVVIRSGADLARQDTFPSDSVPVGGWLDCAPVTCDDFGALPDTVFDCRVRLESEGTRSLFDDVRVVSEPQ